MQKQQQKLPKHGASLVSFLEVSRLIKVAREGITLSLVDISACNVPSIVGAL